MRSKGLQALDQSDQRQRIQYNPQIFRGMHVVRMNDCSRTLAGRWQPAGTVASQHHSPPLMRSCSMGSSSRAYVRRAGELVTVCVPYLGIFPACISSCQRACRISNILR